MRRIETSISRTRRTPASKQSNYYKWPIIEAQDLKDDVSLQWCPKLVKEQSTHLNLASI